MTMRRIAGSDSDHVGRCRFVVRGLCALVLGLCVAGFSGCASPPSGVTRSQWHTDAAIARAGTESDIIKILAMYNKSPWLRRVDADIPLPVGLRISSLYLISQQTGKGVFGEGLLRITLHRVERQPGGSRLMEKVAQWEYTVEQAVDWRVNKQSWMGYGYQFDLRWPEDVDVRGQALALRIEFARRDGKVVRAIPKHFRVPLAL